MTKKYVFFVVGLVLVGLGIALSAHKLMSTRALQAPNPETTPRRELSAYWESRIRTVGGPAAFAEATSQPEIANADAAHKLGHLIGDLLYNTDGPQAMSICDGSFLYGCYHQVIGRTLHDMGVAAIPSLIAQCPHKSDMPNTGCLHGTGHGLLAYFGYDPQGVKKGVAACPKPSPDQYFFSCEQGVFMEYDFNTMENQIPRAFDVHHPDTLCPQLPASMQKLCIFTTAHWWTRKAESSEHPTSLAASGALCDQTFHTDAERRWCYAGIGYAIPSLANYDAHTMGTLCTSASSKATYQAICRVCAAYTTNGINASLINDICAALPGAAHAACIQHHCDPQTLSTL